MFYKDTNIDTKTNIIQRGDHRENQESQETSIAMILSVILRLKKGNLTIKL